MKAISLPRGVYRCPRLSLFSSTPLDVYSPPPQKGKEPDMHVDWRQELVVVGKGWEIERPDGDGRFKDTAPELVSVFGDRKM